MGNGRGGMKGGMEEESEEVKGRKKGEERHYHCMKCVDAHADLPIIKQLLTFWHSGALCTGL